MPRPSPSLLVSESTTSADTADSFDDLDVPSPFQCGAPAASCMALTESVHLGANSHCSLCGEPLDSGSKKKSGPIGRVLPCGHCFHVACYNKWQNEQFVKQATSPCGGTRCPTCSSHAISFAQISRTQFHRELLLGKQPLVETSDESTFSKMLSRNWFTPGKSDKLSNNSDRSAVSEFIMQKMQEDLDTANNEVNLSKKQHDATKRELAEARKALSNVATRTSEIIEATKVMILERDNEIAKLKTELSSNKNELIDTKEQLKQVQQQQKQQLEQQQQQLQQQQQQHASKSPSDEATADTAPSSEDESKAASQDSVALGEKKEKYFRDALRTKEAHLNQIKKQFGVVKREYEMAKRERDHARKELAVKASKLTVVEASLTVAQSKLANAKDVEEVLSHQLSTKQEQLVLSESRCTLHNDLRAAQAKELASTRQMLTAAYEQIEAARKNAEGNAELNKQSKMNMKRRIIMASLASFVVVSMLLVATGAYYYVQSGMEFEEFMEVLMYSMLDLQKLSSSWEVSRHFQLALPVVAESLTKTSETILKSVDYTTATTTSIRIGTEQLWIGLTSMVPAY